MRQTFAIAKLTLISASRFKIFIILVILLSTVIIFLPLIIQSDGTIKGRLQVILEYTLNFVFFILSIATIWLVCGNFLSDVENKTTYMIISKPISRIKIFLGKALGMMLINFFLVLISSSFILGHLYFILRDRALNVEERKILENEVLVGRKIVVCNTETRIVEPKESIIWTFDEIELYYNQAPVFVRFRFFLTDLTDVLKSYIPAVQGEWNFAEGGAKTAYEAAFKTGSFQEFSFPAAMIKNKKLVLTYINKSERSLTFPKDNIEILIKKDSFYASYVKVMLLGFFMLILFTFAALFVSVFMTFPVAILSSMTFYLVSNSVTFLKSIASKTVIFSTGCDCAQHHHHCHHEATILDNVFRMILKGIIFIFPDLKAFNFIENLVLGKAVPWPVVLQGFLVLILGYSLVFAILGVYILNKKEVALIEE